MTTSLRSALSATMDERANRILVLMVLATIMLALTCFMVNQMKWPPCELSAQRPTYEPSKLAHHSPTNHRALVKFAGYLNYMNLSGTRTSRRAYYLPLQLNSIKFQHENDGFWLKLDTQCAKIDLNLEGDGQTSSLIVRQISVQLSLANANFTHCTIAYPDMSADLNKHYSCYTQISYSCTTSIMDQYGQRHIKTVARLHVLALEFEINGNPKLIRQGQFSTKPSPCVA